MPTPAELISESSCFSCLSNRELELVIIQLLRDLLETVEASGTGQCGDYGGNSPSFTPTSDCGWAIDTSTERVWWYYSGSWH